MSIRNWRGGTFLLSALALASAARAGAAAGKSVTLELSAGGHAHRDVPVTWALPESLGGETKFRLARIDGEREEPVPAQVIAKKAPELAWIARGELAAGATRRYRLEVGVAGSARGGVAAVDDGEEVRFSLGGKEILRYRHAVKQPPEVPGVKYGPEYARSGYIHPIRSPSGRLLTNDFPPRHKHHHGLWFPWTNTTFEGRHVDFWNSGKKEGRIECVALEEAGGGPVFGHLRARHRFYDLRAPGGEKPVLDEVWEVRVWAIADGFLFDLVSTQTCAGESPLHLHQYRYGGMGLRGSAQWEGKGDACRFLTSEGRTRKDGHATRAKWCDVFGRVDGETAGIAVLCHPSNFRFPQHMRIHPSEPFFNFAPCQGGEFVIRPGEPYISRYRYLVHDGEADAARDERLWVDYAHPPLVRVVD